jgi:hypothetical protein
VVSLGYPPHAQEKKKKPMAGGSQVTTARNACRRSATGGAQAKEIEAGAALHAMQFVLGELSRSGLRRKTYARPPCAALWVVAVWQCDERDSLAGYMPVTWFGRSSRRCPTDVCQALSGGRQSIPVQSHTFGCRIRSCCVLGRIGLYATDAPNIAVLKQVLFSYLSASCSH